MMRTLAFAVLVLAVGSAAVLADVIQGKIEKIDPEKGTLTIKADGKTRELPVEKEADIFYKPVGKKKGVAVADGLKGLKAGWGAMVFTETKKGKEVVTQVRVEETGPVKKKKKDK